jgi:hypothetical protein
MLKRTIAAAILAVPMVSVGFAASPAAANGNGNPCVFDGDDTKVDAVTTELNTFVVPDGVEFCVKGSNANTGKLVGDGETTLIGRMFKAGITNGGGKTPDVSHYVIYNEPVPTCESHPSPELCAKPESDTEERPKSTLDCATKTVTTWREYRDFTYAWDSDEKAWVGSWGDWAEVEESRETVPATAQDCLPHVGNQMPVMLVGLAGLGVMGAGVGAMYAMRRRA